MARSSTVLGSSGSAGSSLGQFQGPANLSIGTRGIYVADALNNRVQFFDPLHTATGSSLTPFSAEGSLAAALSLSQPDAVAAVEDLLEQKIYIADTGNDRILLVKLPADDPLTVWNNMVSRLAAADTPGAVANFCSATAEGYRQAFLTLGTGDSASDVNAIGSLTPVFIRGDTAEYYFEQTVDGHLLLFKVEFVKENGLWKILEF